MNDLNPIAEPFIPKSKETIGRDVTSKYSSAHVSGGSHPNTPVFIRLNFELFIIFLITAILSSQIVLCLIGMSGGVFSDGVSPHAFLQSLRLKNLERITIAHLNINSIRNKIGLLEDMVRGRIDILLVSETKIDGSFPLAQFRVGGYSDPY